MHKNSRTRNSLLHYGLLVFIYGVGLATLLGHTALHAIINQSDTNHSSHATDSH